LRDLVLPVTEESSHGRAHFPDGLTLIIRSNAATTAGKVIDAQCEVAGNAPAVSGHAVGVTPAARRERFELLYDGLYAPIAGYVLRRTRSPEDAAEAIAETFTTLWRRLESCPDGDEARPWLFGVARRVLANQRRGEKRRDALAERLTAELDPSKVAAAAAPGSDSRVARAFAALSEGDREILALLAWEGLTRDELSVALGVSRPVIRLRLHRARRRFEAALDAPTPLQLSEGRTP
jgi:RNA polymerase sigma-70 factor (ECF subfamily)